MKGVNLTMFWRQVWPELFVVCVLSPLYLPWAWGEKGAVGRAQKVRVYSLRLFGLCFGWELLDCCCGFLLHNLAVQGIRNHQLNSFWMALIVKRTAWQQFWVCLQGICLMTLMKVGSSACYTEQRALPWDPRSYKRSKWVEESMHLWYHQTQHKLVHLGHGRMSQPM